MPKVVFVKEKKEIEVPVGANLREEARKAGIEVYQGLSRYLNCFGHGTCGTCRVLVKKGMENLSPKGRSSASRIARMLATHRPRARDAPVLPAPRAGRLHRRNPADAELERRELLAEAVSE